jgi:hypothetical protein
MKEINIKGIDMLLEMNQMLKEKCKEAYAVAGDRDKMIKKLREIEEILLDALALAHSGVIFLTTKKHPQRKEVIIDENNNNYRDKQWRCSNYYS